jgi:hypothetical protein
VGGVGDEATLRVECPFQAGEEPVDRVTKLGELVSGPGKSQALMEVVFGDVLGGIGDSPQRSQDSPGEEPAEQQGYPDHEGQGDARTEDELVEVEIERADMYVVRRGSRRYSSLVGRGVGDGRAVSVDVDMADGMK